MWTPLDASTPPIFWIDASNAASIIVDEFDKVTQLSDLSRGEHMAPTTAGPTYTGLVCDA